MVMTPNELRMVLQETGASAHYDLGSPRKVAGDLLILHHTATDAADAWEADRFDLGVYKATFAEMSQRLEAAERENAVLRKSVPANKLKWLQDRGMATRYPAALAGEEP
jgi:hypothetical protein